MLCTSSAACWCDVQLMISVSLKSGLQLFCAPAVIFVFFHSCCWAYFFVFLCPLHVQGELDLPFTVQPTSNKRKPRHTEKHVVLMGLKGDRPKEIRGRRACGHQHNTRHRHTSPRPADKKTYRVENTHIHLVENTHIKRVEKQEGPTHAQAVYRATHKYGCFLCWQ